MPDFDLDAVKARQATARAQAAAELDTEPVHLDPRIIAACPLCDDDGLRGARVCDHIDHTAAAKRGMARLRQTMGWDRPAATQAGETGPGGRLDAAARENAHRAAQAAKARDYSQPTRGDE